MHVQSKVLLSFLSFICRFSLFFPGACFLALFLVFCFILYFQFQFQFQFCVGFFLLCFLFLWVLFTITFFSVDVCKCSLGPRNMNLLSGGGEHQHGIMMQGMAIRGRVVKIAFFRVMKHKTHVGVETTRFSVLSLFLFSITLVVFCVFFPADVFCTQCMHAACENRTFMSEKIPKSGIWMYCMAYQSRNSRLVMMTNILLLII